MRHVKLIFAWYDFWVGLFWDKKKKILYFFPIPMLGIVFRKHPANIHGLEIGDQATRRKEFDNRTEWRVFMVNETYMPLIAEFPEDYKPI